MTAVGIVGPGRAGVGLGFAFSRAGHRVFVHGRRSSNLPVPLELSWGGNPPWLGVVEVVLLAVPDDALNEVAVMLGRTGKVEERHTVLHVSGVLDHHVLEPLGPTGAALGSLHPFQSLSNPLAAPERLKGAVAAVEGAERAVQVASTLARSIGLHPLRVEGANKTLYHAAAVFASNYIVVVGSVAESLLLEAGLTPDEAREALAPLVAGTVANMRHFGPRQALTGPVVRGDSETIRRHLESVPAETAELYRALARAALRLVDLPAEKRAAVEAVLQEQSAFRVPVSDI